MALYNKNEHQEYIDEYMQMIGYEIQEQQCNNRLMRKYARYRTLYDSDYDFQSEFYYMYPDEPYMLSSKQIDEIVDNKLEEFRQNNTIQLFPLIYDKRVKSKARMHGTVKDKFMYFFIDPSEQVPKELKGTHKEAGWIIYQKNKIAQKVIQVEGKYSGKKHWKKHSKKQKRKALKLRCNKML